VIAILLVAWLAPPTVVLVTGAAPGPDAGRIETARDQLRTRYRVVDGPRDALEGYTVPPSPEESTRDALERAHQRMRRFDLAGVRQALAEAREASTHLPPTDEGRRLAAVVALREAELAIVAKDRPGQRRAAAFALSIDPALTPDPQRVPPPVVELVAQVRQAIAKQARVRVRVETTPAGGRVVMGDRSATAAPAEIEVPPGPLVVWGSREGSAPRALWLDKPSDAIKIELEPLDDAARLRPLVGTLRQAAPEHRRSAALALADALGVDAVALLDADAREPAVYTRRIPALAATPPPAPALVTPPEPPAPPPHTPVYKRAWFWAVLGGVAVASAGAVAIYYFAQPESVSYTCCR
jgi:hypothetical protein